MLPRCKTYFLVGWGNRTNTLVKELASKSNPIGWLALGQGFFSPPAFFEDVKRFQTTIGQDLQLLLPETYFLVGQNTWTKPLVKESARKLHSIDWLASGQAFLKWAVFGGGFWLIFAGFLLEIQFGDWFLQFYIKHLPKSNGWERFAHWYLQKKTCSAVQIICWVFLGSWHTYSSKRTRNSRESWIWGGAILRGLTFF